MTRSRHGDYVNGYVAKTSDNSSMHCGFSSHERVLNRIWNWLKVYIFKLEDFNRVTRGKQHISRYNCICNTFLENTYKPPLPKNKTNTDLYIQVIFNVFNFGLLNFYPDSLIWKVMSPTPWFEKLVANAEKNHASLMTIW